MIDLESQAKPLKFWIDGITTDLDDEMTIRNKSIGIEEILKKVPRWSYKLTNGLEENENEEELTEDSL